MDEEEELRDKLYVAAMNNEEVELTAAEALLVWRVMGPSHYGFKVGDRVTWGVGASSYLIHHFGPDGYAYMDDESGIFIADGTKAEANWTNGKAKVKDLRRA